MRIFLVDTENVGWAGLTGASKLDSSDTIYILIGKGVNSRAVKGDIVVDLLKSKAQYVIEETKHEGKNYLDFQLSLIVGRLVERHDDAEFIIISKDQGYKAVTDYLTKYFIEHHKKDLKEGLFVLGLLLVFIIGAICSALLSTIYGNKTILFLVPLYLTGIIFLQFEDFELIKNNKGL